MLQANAQGQSSRVLYRHGTRVGQTEPALVLQPAKNTRHSLNRKPKIVRNIATPHSARAPQKIHAERNLRDFLTNDADSANYRANEFIAGYAADDKQIHGKLFRMHTQVLHLGKKRPTDPKEKINSQDRAVIYKWLIDTLRDWESQLGEPYRSEWHWVERAPKHARVSTVTQSH